MKTFLLTIFAISVLSVAGRAEENGQRLNQVVEYALAGNKFMGSVFVSKEGTVLLDKGYGYSNLEWETLNTPETKFRISSLTKQFTAVAILLLEEHGKLKLDDPVNKYLPDCPAAWDKITIFHLLTHTSGIPELSDAESESHKALPSSPLELVAAFRDKPLLFQPGEDAQYSNSGYLLLGYLIEKTSGRPYAQFLADEIFNPLGMKDSGYDSNRSILRQRASGYVLTAMGLKNADYTDMTRPFSAGGLYSTTHDLSLWEHSLFTGKLLSAGSIQKMTTPVTTPKRKGPGMGIGVTSQPRRAFIHGGGMDGFNSGLAYYPDDKVVIVVLGNVRGSAVDEIFKKLSSVTFGKKIVLPSERVSLALSPEKAAKYVGTYEIQPGVNVFVSLEEGQLMMSTPSKPKEAIFPSTERLFFVKTEETELEFVVDGDRVSGLVATGGFGKVKATKKVE